MSNARYNQIIDEVYGKYIDSTPSEYVVGSDSDPMRKIMAWKRKVCHLSGYPILERLTENEFINKCKNDQEFSEKWGLEIEERELSSVERWEWYGKNGGPNGEILLVGMIAYQNEEDNSHIKSWLEKFAPNVPTRLITLTYQNELIQFYE
jgi:hypothetical protein